MTTTTAVSLNFPTTRPTELDLDSAKLQAAKTVNAGALNSHGVQLVSVNPSNPTGNPAAPTYAGSQAQFIVTT